MKRPIFTFLLWACSILALSPFGIAGRSGSGSSPSISIVQQPELTRTKKIDDKSGFTWTEVRNGTRCGVEIGGKTIVPCKFTSVAYSNGKFFATIAGTPQQVALYKSDGTVLIDLKNGYENYAISDDSPFCSVKKNGYEGLYHLDRHEEIISPSKGYTSIAFWSVKDSFVVVSKGDNKGLYDISQGREIVPTSLGYTSISLYKIETGRINVNKGDSEGIYDLRSNREVISPNAGYDSIVQLEEKGVAYYCVKKNKKQGVCSWDGNEVISPDRGYDSAFLRIEEGTAFYSIKKDGKSGICLANGSELLPPKYESAFYSSTYNQFKYEDSDGNFHDTGLGLDGRPIDGSASTVSTTTSTASSASSSSVSSNTPGSESTSGYGALLYEGDYTFTGQVIQNLQITNTGVTLMTNFKIYENVLFDEKGEPARYVGNSNFFTFDCRKYVTNNNPDVFYYVNVVGIVYMGTSKTEFIPFVGNVTSVMYMIYEPGDTRSQHSTVPQGGYNNGSGGVAPSQGNNASREQMYRNQYAQWEKTVISHWNTLTSMRDGAARTSVRMNFRNAQSQMRHIRQNAQMEGISIPASAWETASVPLGYE